MSWDYDYAAPIRIRSHGRLLSGIEIEQNQRPANTNHGITPGFAWYYQQFQLPTNFVRGTDTDQIIPKIGGIQVKTQVPKHLTDQATIDYTLDYQIGDVWTTVGSGISIGANTYGDEVWFDIYFTNPLTVTPAILNATFRFGVRGRQQPPPEQRHKCLPIRRWNNKWYHYNYFKHYGLSFDQYNGYDEFYEDYPYYEWGYHGFPYFYSYPWWGEYWGDFLGNRPYLPFDNPYYPNWNLPFGYHNANLYNDWYWNYYGHPYSPSNFYDYFRDTYLPLTDSGRWWHNWDDWSFGDDTFPILAFDEGVVPDTLNDLIEETPYPIEFQGNYCYIMKHSEPEFHEQWGFNHQYCLHTQYGLPWLWFSSPNPYVNVENSFVTDANETQVLQDGNTISFVFRLLTLTTDSGTDELGENYRNTVVIHEAENLDTLNSPANEYFNWYSKPNPSKFAVESLYFDISDADGNPQVFDRVYLNPITTGPYFNVYTSSDGVPGTTREEWEKKNWTRVPQTYQLTKAQGYVMPSPVTTKYVCIEFTHLQAIQYNGSDSSTQVVYQKHPKWVLDYFLIQLAGSQETSKFVVNSTTVVYNALDLAYNYYLDDIGQTASTSAAPAPSLSTVKSYLLDTTDPSDQISPTMIGQIKTVLQPYISSPISNTDLSTMVAQYALNAFNNVQGASYQVEINPASQAPTIGAQVSSTNRNDLVLAADYPVMYFYIPCNHIYRQVSADFSSGVAYWVGLQQLAFQRDHYTAVYDADSYVENGGDSVNLELNDLVRVDNAWAAFANPS